MSKYFSKKSIVLSIVVLFTIVIWYSGIAGMLKYHGRKSELIQLEFTAFLMEKQVKELAYILKNQEYKITKNELDNLLHKFDELDTGEEIPWTTSVDTVVTGNNDLIHYFFDENDTLYSLKYLNLDTQLN